MQAPPGAGKTTLVPLALLDAAWLRDNTIVMLEPRRLATRAAAHRMAELLGEAVGETVGYRMRGDSRVSRRTRIEVVTEGILTRRLQRDPTLDGVGIVIFDEFHERSLNADIGLALTRRTQTLVRADLRILVMSATLDGDTVAQLLGGAPIISSQGRIFPVDTQYVPPQRNERVEASVAKAIRRSIAADTGDVLVFLPGAGEIRRVASLLDTMELAGAEVFALYGALPAEEQDRAIRGDGARRRIVLATSIAETSLTIEGIRVVIDSGLSRSPRFSPRTGMTRLETTRVSQASADQRRGRAGRVAPGVCYRLWAEHDNGHLLASSPPEITIGDLAPLALDLAAAGVSDPLDLDWLNAPAPSAYAQALELLTELDAIDASGITDHGRAMAALPLHPRLGHMVLRASDIGHARRACDIAALLAGRDVLQGGAEGPIDADLSYRLALMRPERGDGQALPAGARLDYDALRRARGEATRLARMVAGDQSEGEPGGEPGMLLALAYPDRIGQRRTGVRSRYVLRNGRGAELTGQQTLAQSAYIVAAELDDQQPESRIFLAAALSIEEIRVAFGSHVVTEDAVEFNDATASVVARRRERLGAIVLRDVALARPSRDQTARAMMDGIRRRGVPALTWSDAARRLRERIAFVGRQQPGWPGVSDNEFLAALEHQLQREDSTGRAMWRLADLDLEATLVSMLDWRQRRALDELAPTHVEVPSGSRIPVNYENAESPVLAVRLQEVFGLADSPCIANGHVRLTIHLLSPANRLVQVTQDLSSFWRAGYYEVRKDLRARYPKHEWPLDPLVAKATSRVKRR